MGQPWRQRGLQYLKVRRGNGGTGSRSGGEGGRLGLGGGAVFSGVELVCAWLRLEPWTESSW